MSLNTENAILSNAIKVDSSYNVGIGGAPVAAYKVDVTGAFKSSAAGYFGGATAASGLAGASELIVQNEIGIQNTDTTGPYLRMVVGAANQNITFVTGAFSGTEPNLLFSVGGTTRLTISASTGGATFSGAITATGLTTGTTGGSTINITTSSNAGTSGSPLQTKLNFLGYNGNINGQIRVDDISSTAQVGSMSFYTWNSAQVLALTLAHTGAATFAGSVGIGTSPSYSLDLLTSSSGALNTIAQFQNTDYTAGNRTFIRVRAWTNSGGSYSSYFGQGQDGNLYIIANNSARGGDLVINGNTGNVLLGTTTDSGYKLNIKGGTPTGIKFTDDDVYTSFQRSYFVQFTNTYDIVSERTDGGSYEFLLLISSVLVASGSNFNTYTFAVGGRATNCSAAQLHNIAGGTPSRSAISVSFPAYGTVRLTLTGGETCNVKITLLGLNGV